LSPLIVLQLFFFRPCTSFFLRGPSAAPGNGQLNRTAGCPLGGGSAFLISLIPLPQENSESFFTQRLPRRLPQFSIGKPSAARFQAGKKRLEVRSGNSPSLFAPDFRPLRIRYMRLLCYLTARNRTRGRKAKAQFPPPPQVPVGPRVFLFGGGGKLF